MSLCGHGDPAVENQALKSDLTAASHPLYLNVPRRQEPNLSPKPNSGAHIWPIWSLILSQKWCSWKTRDLQVPHNIHPENTVQVCFGQGEQGCHLYIYSFNDYFSRASWMPDTLYVLKTQLRTSHKEFLCSWSLHSSQEERPKQNTKNKQQMHV